MQISGYILCANEFSLAIALTVFILITVILTALLIALAASKNFRAVFFREKQKRKKNAKKPAISSPAPSEPQAAEAEPIEQPKPRRAAPRKSAVGAEPDYLDGIPTIPLGGIPQITPQPTPRGSRRSSSPVRTVEASTAPDQGGTYTTRSITITRARSTKLQTQDDEKNKPGNTETSRAVRAPRKK